MVLEVLIGLDGLRVLKGLEGVLTGIRRSMEYQNSEGSKGLKGHSNST